MTEDVRKLCVVCAWRVNCAKRFNMADSATLHCPDFTEDLALRKQKAESDSEINKDS